MINLRLLSYGITHIALMNDSDKLTSIVVSPGWSNYGKGKGNKNYIITVSLLTPQNPTKPPVYKAYT